MNDQKGILLESGTNELEIIVFTIDNNTFGINVLKVREIINPLPIVKVPNSHPFVEGIIRLRDEVMTVIDLAKALGCPESENHDKDKFIVAELNQMKVAFHVHTVSRIHRISWQQIEKPDELSQGLEASTIGVVKMEDQMILLLDYEKILVDINPESGINVGQLKTLGKRERNLKKIVVAEDSSTLRNLLESTLSEAGYVNLQFYNDGKEAWEFLEQIKQTNNKASDEVQLVITDLEMPLMDGHHLTKRIKEDEELKELPVIIFSSLITGDLFHKGVKVGADAQVSKPEIVELVHIIDKYIL